MWVRAFRYTFSCLINITKEHIERGQKREEVEEETKQNKERTLI